MSANNKIKGAGFLVQAFQDNALYILLGRDDRNNKWGTFGGTINKKHYEKPLACALRELYEETRGLVRQDKMLSCRKDKHYDFGGFYRLYSCEIAYDLNLPEAFIKRGNQPDFKDREYNEKTELCWFKFHEVINLPDLHEDTKRDFQEIYEDLDVFRKICIVTGYKPLQ